MALLQSIEDNRITLTSGRVVTFPFSVADATEFDDVIVVRIQPPREIIFNENVFGIGPDGRQIWRIQREYPPSEDVPWGGLEKMDGEARLSNWQSKLVYIDPKTGVITRRGMSAW